MWSILTTCLVLILAQGDVTVTSLQGEAVRGALLELSEKGVSLQTASGRVDLSAATIHTVRFATPATVTVSSPVAVMVELIDESVMSAIGFVSSEKTAYIDMQDGQRQNISSDLVRAVRFRKQDEVMRKQWDEIIAGPHGGDVLVIRKTNQSTVEKKEPVTVVLDQLEGIVHEVKPDKVVFEYDGSRIDVSREKVEGILYRQRAGIQLPGAVCNVKGLTGDRWVVRSLQWQDGKLRLTSVAGAQVEIPAARLQTIDFSAENLLYLSDLDPESMEWRPYFRSAATPGSLSKWFEPKRDRGADGLPLTLKGQSYEKGMAIHSRSVLSYRLTKNYRRFLATVGVDERNRATANLHFVILGDDRPLLDRTIKGADEPLDVDLEIQGVRRLKILVDFGEDNSDVGDLLNLCNARLTK